MFNKIIFPVDLTHADALDKALSVAGGLAKAHDAELIVVGVTSEQPTPVAHNPKEYEAKLADYAATASEKTGLPVQHRAVTAHDPSIEVDAKILSEARAVGADLVVMASHVPGLAERLFASRAGHLAAHADMSVFVVR